MTIGGGATNRGRTASTRRLAARIIAGLALAGLAVVVGAIPAAAGSRSVLVYIVQSRTALDGRIEVASASGGGAHLLATGTAALVAPNGRSVAVVRSLPPQDDSTTVLMVYPEQGGSPRRLYHCAGFFTLYGWSEDSTLILGTCPHGLNQRGPLLTANATSGRVSTLASGVVEGASFAPSSGQVVYALGSSQLLSAPVDLFTVSATGGQTRRLTARGISTDPLWGPNGIIFARQRSRGNAQEPVNQLWSIRPDGSGARQLTHMPVNPLASGLVPVAMSANGKHLLADFEGTDQSSAWAVDLSSAVVIPRRLGDSENIADAISRSGSTVLFTNGFEGNPTSVDSVPFAGGAPTVLVARGANASWNA